jgi:anti-sigma B factor antagonist
VTVSTTPSDATVVLVRGELDIATAPLLRERLDDLLSSGTSAFTVDLSAMTFIDSTGLGVIVGAFKRSREAGGDLVLRSPVGAARKVLEISGLASVIEIID